MYLTDGLFTLITCLWTSNSQDKLEEETQRSAQLEKTLCKERNKHAALERKIVTAQQTEQERLAALELQRMQDMYIAKRLG